MFDGLGVVPLGAVVGGDDGGSSVAGIGGDGNDGDGAVSGGRGIGRVDFSGGDNNSRARTVHC